MKLEIVYTPEARVTLNSIYNFITAEFGNAASNRFAIRTEKTIDLTAGNPLMFKASSIDESVRVAVITKQTSLFYRVTDTAIHLLYFWDNRQDPQFSR